jgi:hypothetical protein
LLRLWHSDLTSAGDGIFYDKQSAEILLRMRANRSRDGVFVCATFR